MKKVSKIVIGLTIATAAITAQAAEKGYFVEGGIGTNTAASYENKSFAVVTDGLALVGNAGYEFNKYIAAEGGYTLHHDGDVTPSNMHDLHAAARATLPLGNKAKLFGKLGVATVMADGLNTRVGPFFGVGGSYVVNDATDITVQYQGVHLSENQQMPNFTLGSVTAGVTYHFG